MNVMKNTLWDSSIKKMETENYIFPCMDWSEGQEFFKDAKTALTEILNEREELNNGPRHVVQSLFKLSKLCFYHEKYSVACNEEIYAEGKDFIERAKIMQLEYKGRSDNYLIDKLLPLDDLYEKRLESSKELKRPFSDGTKEIKRARR